ncbi:hypothetical protein [Nocardia sp. NPDC004750]
MEGIHHEDGRPGPAVFARVTTAARQDPDAAAPDNGFAARALAAQPEVPGWIAWLFEHASEQLARIEYQMHYPLDHTGDPAGRGGGEWLITQRAYHAECSARSVERARRFHRDRPGVVQAHTPALPDDTQFYAALAAGQEWSGHWYSRDPVQAWGMSGPVKTRPPGT